MSCNFCKNKPLFYSLIYIHKAVESTTLASMATIVPSSAAVGTICRIFFESNLLVKWQPFTECNAGKIVQIFSARDGAGNEILKYISCHKNRETICLNNLNVLAYSRNKFPG